jgi:hypothetical protein
MRPRTVLRAISAFVPMLFGIAAVGIGSGCGGGAPTQARVPLTGNVTYNSKPVASGLLVLQPLGAGQPVSTSIIDGKYSFTTGTGPLAGRHHVTITRTGAEEIAQVNRGMGEGGRRFPPPRRPVNRPGEKNIFELDADIAVGDQPVKDFDLNDESPGPKPG